MSIILQEKAQLEALYRKHAQTIFGGDCGHKLYFAGLTCREAALGQQTRYDADSAGGREERKAAAPLLRHDEIRMLPADKAILISGGGPPLRFGCRPISG